MKNKMLNVLIVAILFGTMFSCTEKKYPKDKYGNDIVNGVVQTKETPVEVTTVPNVSPVVEAKDIRPKGPAPSFNNPVRYSILKDENNCYWVVFPGNHVAEDYGAFKTISEAQAIINKAAAGSKRAWENGNWNDWAASENIKITE
jgi:hypothetical protein